MKEPIGRCGSAGPSAVAADGLGDRLHGSILVDDLLPARPPCEETLGLLLLDQAVERDARHLGDDLGDQLLVDRAATFARGFARASSFWSSRFLRS
jgi:hypothetical protein